MLTTDSPSLAGDGPSTCVLPPSAHAATPTYPPNVPDQPSGQGRGSGTALVDERASHSSPATIIEPHGAVATTPLPDTVPPAAPISALTPEQVPAAGVDCPPTVPLPPLSKRYQSLDLWRGAACLMLLFYHTTFYAESEFRLSDSSSWSWSGLPLCILRYGWIGVPIFFVISGYCISASIDSLRRRPHSLRDYFLRRFRRIYPPLWAMCGLAVLFTWGVSQLPLLREECQQLPILSELNGWQWLGNFLAAESWRHNLVGGEPAYLLRNTWTLCYEEQFYCVTGLLLALGARRFFAAAAWGTAAAILARLVFQWAGFSPQGFFWDGHWTLFATGILVYHTLNYPAPQRRMAALAVLALGMLWGASERVLATDDFQQHLGEYLFVACGFAVGLIYLRRWDQQVAQLRLAAPLRWCGQHSYSIYLTHYLLVVVLSCWLAWGGLRSAWLVATVVAPACLLLSLPAAAAFYHLVERHFLSPPRSNGAGEGRAVSG